MRSWLPRSLPVLTSTLRPLLIQSLHFHFQTSPDERTYALGIIVADRLAHVIIEAAVALEVWLLYVWTRARTEAAHSTAAGKTDGLVRIYLDEVFQNSLISLDACFLIFLAEVALAVTLEENIGKHA